MGKIWENTYFRRKRHHVESKYLFCQRRVGTNKVFQFPKICSLYTPLHRYICKFLVIIAKICISFWCLYTWTFVLFTQIKGGILLQVTVWKWRLWTVTWIEYTETYVLYCAVKADFAKAALQNCVWITKQNRLIMIISQLLYSMIKVKVINTFMFLIISWIV